ncbi:hypothetical protein L4D06_09140 [Enterovibrio makurazakiensis]|uniref:hypothetical protein n=1 Tax=Enterovibrio makurazakiensis TaxID=2910232 RepID=UPI003D1CFE24
MKKCRLSGLCGLALASTFPLTVLAENLEESAWGGNAVAYYSQNGFDKDDYRSIRSLNWSAKGTYKISELYLAYLTSGGYRAYEDETGDFFTDTALGLSRSSLVEFGETGKVGAQIQLTLPTSEFSRKNDLQSGVRLATSVTANALGIDFYLSPRYRKNFHEYKTTVNGKVLTEHIVSVVGNVGYGLGDAYFEGTVIGGTSWTYQGSRRDWTYVGEIKASYPLTENLSAALSASNSGVYYDAERGTLGNIDLFDEKEATYTASLTFSF